MKYDILVPIFTSVHPILSVYIFTGSKTIFDKKKFKIFWLKKSDFFLANIVFEPVKNIHRQIWMYTCENLD